MKKKLYFVTEQRFHLIDGNYYTEGGFPFPLFRTYLDIFSEIVVIARVSTTNKSVKDNYTKISLRSVSFLELPYYIGPTGFYLHLLQIRKVLKEKISDDGLYLCRVPGNIADEVIRVLKKKKIPYVCHVVGDPDLVFSKDGVQHPLRPLIRKYAINRLKNNIASSVGNVYVTKTTLQEKYPPNPDSISISLSDVIIKDEIIANSAKVLVDKKCYNIISVGSLDQMYKAPDIIIKAIADLKSKGIHCKLTWLGDGIFRERMKNLSLDLGVSENVAFLGNVSAEEVVNHLKQSDIFAMVSRTEGLPRALIEAMAQGLPCIGSNVGGIPELISKECIVEKENVLALSSLIKKMVQDHAFTNHMANTNLINAHNYLSSKLNSERIAFYKEILQRF